MATLPPHSQHLQTYLYDIPDHLGNFWDELIPDQSYSDKMRTRQTDRARKFAQQRALNEEMRLNAESTRDMYNTREYAPQGVTRPAAQSYGSEDMYNYQQSAPQKAQQVIPANTVPAQYKKGLGSQHQMLVNQGMEPPAEVDAMLRNKVYRDKAGIINQGKEVIDSDVKGTAAIHSGNNYVSAKDFEAAGGAMAMPQIPQRYKTTRSLGSAQARDNMYNFNRNRAAAGKLHLDTSQFGYEGMPPEAYKRMELERMGLGAMNKPAPLTQSQQYHADLKSKSLPTRDMRQVYNVPTVTPGSNIQYHNPTPSAQTKVLGTNVQDPLGRQGDSAANQTPGTQVANNGNVNNPKSMNNPNANRGNGFWN